LLSLLLAAAVLEIVLRIFGPPYYRFNNLSQEYYTNPRGYHDVLRKEGRQTVYGLDYHEGPHGYRIPANHPQQTIDLPEKHILGLGDSFTYGRGVRYDDIYLSRMKKVLNNGQNKVAIKNCAIVGATTEDVVNIYARESVEMPSESLVIYGFVLNDFGLIINEPIKGYNFIDFNNEGNTFNPLRKRSALINFVSHSIEKRRLHMATLRAYLDAFEGENAVNGFGQLSKLHQATLKNNHTLLVVVFPLLYDFDDYRFISVHRKIENFCNGHGILYLDLFPEFSRHRAEDLWSNPTDHHPNEIAHAIAATEIARFIEHQLAGLSQKPVQTLTESASSLNSGSVN
jgi:hypothetical protein